ncbi:MAG TPA: DNA gyrase subunit A, partial [Clostridiales bacterium]|nr:DNA gyrase subunit A [Clostridiales bacterium]
MAHKRDYKPEDIAFPEQHIVSSELVSEMEKSYIEYAMSVIVGRALPDVRDGLKPVHRRILYAMYEDGLTRDKPYRKCATAVGDVLGRYHPHGDASVYDALVRMAQDFSLRYPLIDGHGNFGDVDGNPPAAYRYTEARLARMADEMLRDIDKDTVDWDPNFDETRKEPRVLPSRIPQLLVNGSSGIAVGMATNIPPHNLREVIGAAVEVLDNPDATLDDLMRHVHGPDFPTKGIIMGRAGIRAAYATGRGKVTIRARTEFEEHGQNRVRIIVNELPYQVNKKMLIKNIAEQVKDKRLDDISDLRDESDRNGMRIVIELKRDANPQVALNKLFAQTQLQSTFSIINLALVDNQRQPKILSLRHILDEYLTFQEEVITRRTKYDLRKARERAHLLEGLLIAQDNIDEVIHIIRTSYDNAKENLMARFGLDDVQAQAILDMRLKALQGLDREKLQNEYDELEKKIEYLVSLLEDPEKLKGVLKDELLAIADKYGDDRKTEIQDVEDEIDMEDLIAEEECVFTLSHNGYIKRTPAAEYRAQSRGGKGVRGMATREEDYVESVFTASTHDFILFFSSRGQVYVRKGYQIPEAGRSARGTNIVNILPLEPEEKISAMLRGKGLQEDDFIMFFTKNGVTKRMSQLELRNVRKNGIRALDIREGDELVQALTTHGSEKLLVVTRGGMAIRFDENDVRPMGRTAAGVRAIRLKDGDEVVAAVRATDEDAAVLTVTENGYGKRTRIGEYSVQNRGG